jgi:hypothetical protein
MTVTAKQINHYILEAYDEIFQKLPNLRIII